ncbi:MAG: hypothetical protein WEB90_04070 [Gemmatimonadota bacterium]
MSEPSPTNTLANQLVEAAGGSVRAVLLYGSQLLRTRPDEHSAFDFVVLVEAYRPFYAALRASGQLPRPVWLMSTLARVLAPNVIAFAPEEGRAGIAKCLVVSQADFERALGPTPRDHFLLGRMVQRVAVVWAADPSEERWVEERLAGARGRVLDWLAPYLEGPVDAAGLGRRLLEVCYEGELRPEAKDRAHKIYEAQEDHFRKALAPVLERAAAEGRVVREGPKARYALARPATAAERSRWRRHFRRSKARATARWLKHTLTFANWLPYIVRKVERHTGRTIHLTPLERKLPLIFLWPRAVHVLLSRPQREIRP